MRKLTTIIVCLLLTVPALAQQVIVAKKKSGSTPLTRTDNFNRASENPLVTGWTTVSSAEFADMQLAGTDYVTGTDTSGDFAAYWDGDSFAANQFSAVEATGQNLGVIVRVNSNAMYLFRRTTSGTFQMWKMPGWNQLGADYTGVSFSDGQIIRLEATGTGTVTLTPIVNGVTLATRTDSSSALDSGGVGIYCSHNAPTSILDNWAGGEL